MTKDITAFHEWIDRQTAALYEQHGTRLQCRRGCASCCVDELTVSAVEAEHIRAHATDLLETGAPHPKGRCAFLDEHEACRIYAWRPYVCRTQGLPLRWLDEDDEGYLVEYRDICPLNEDGPPIETLTEDHCWTIGPAEQELASIQQQRGSNNAERVLLRTLFKEQSDT